MISSLLLKNDLDAIPEVFIIFLSRLRDPIRLKVNDEVLDASDSRFVVTFDVDFFVGVRFDDPNQGPQLGAVVPLVKPSELSFNVPWVAFPAEDSVGGSAEAQAPWVGASTVSVDD